MTTTERNQIQEVYYKDDFCRKIYVLLFYSCVLAL
jgi:hypothetical protein